MPLPRAAVVRSFSPLDSTPIKCVCLQFTAYGEVDVEDGEGVPWWAHFYRAFTRGRARIVYSAGGTGSVASNIMAEQ